MNPQKTPHIWSKESLYNKALCYSEEMHSHNQSDWQFAFWSALTLEMLIRSAAASISPVLIADGKDWTNLMFATGQTPNVKKFTPKSAEVTTLINILEPTFLTFTKEMSEFCILHVNRRNSEIHSGDMPFKQLGTSKWLPHYYTICECLLSILSYSLDDFLDDDSVKSARANIQSFKDDASKSVNQIIAAHKTTWLNKNQNDRQKLIETANNTMTRYFGHRVACPACNNTALLHGSPSGKVKTEFSNDVITEKQSMLPSSFECTACQLKINGYSKLIHCGLGDVYTTTSYADPSDFYGTSTSHHEDMMDEDNNEPF